MSTIQEIVDRAIRDPGFVAWLHRDPIGTARAVGYEGSADELKFTLGIDGASGEELAEALEARISHSMLLLPHTRRRRVPGA
jgi:hypothetical protein